MSRTETINKVPNAEVAQVKEDFESQGATVVVTPDGPDTSKVVATFNDSSAALASATAAHASAAAAHASAADAMSTVLKILAKT